MGDNGCLEANTATPYLVVVAARLVISIVAVFVAVNVAIVRNVVIIVN